MTAIPVLTTITVSPASASIQTGSTKQFNATALDQFGQPMSAQTFTWSVDVGGDSTVDPTGKVTAGATTGNFTVRATIGARAVRRASR